MQNSLTRLNIVKIKMLMVMVLALLFNQAGKILAKLFIIKY